MDCHRSVADRLALYVEEDGEYASAPCRRRVSAVAERAGVAFAAGTTVTEIVLGSAGEVRRGADRPRHGQDAMPDQRGRSISRRARADGRPRAADVPVRHSYFVTAPLATITRPLPHLRFTEEGLYARTREGGVMIGGGKRPGAGRSLDPREVPGDRRVPFPALPWTTYEAFADLARDHMPDLDRWPRQAFGPGGRRSRRTASTSLAPAAACRDSCSPPDARTRTGSRALPHSGCWWRSRSARPPRRTSRSSALPVRPTGFGIFGAAIEAARGFSARAYNTIAAEAA